MNRIKFSRTPKALVIFCILMLVLSLTGSSSYTVSSAEEYDEDEEHDEEEDYEEDEEDEGDIKAGSWEELITALSKIDDESETIIHLTDDIAPEEEADDIVIENKRDIILDLAGHTINRGLKDSALADKGYVIIVSEGGKLTLTDTTGKGGIITGGANSGNGGGILCEDKSTLTVTGGIEIKNNRAAKGAGIYLGTGCELFIGDCTISGNDVTEAGGGIYGGQSHITFLGGLTKVKNNYKGGDDENFNDLYMPADMEKLRFWIINEKGKTKYCEGFKDGSRIGILLEEMSKVITDGYGQCNPEEASIYFFYNTAGYEISDNKKNSEVSVVKEEETLHDNTATVVEIYKGDRLKSSKQMDSFNEALNEALDASGDEKVVILGGDYTSDEQIVIPKDKEVVIDLNGHYIKRDRNYETEKNGGVFRVEGGATLTIRDSHPRKNGYDGIKGGVITGGASSNAGGGITIEEEGHLVMEGGTIYDCISDEDGGGVYVTTGSKKTSFKMTGGRINNCRTIDSIDECYGGAIFFGDGLLELSGGTIDDCFSEDDGGAIYCRRGEVRLNDMIFSGNHSVNRGGAIYIGLDYAIYDGTLFTAVGCTFVNNESQEDGGAFFMRDNPQHKGAVLFDHCIFRGNKAAEDGGALVVFDDGMVLSNVEITDNTAGEYGGGVFVDSRYDISLKGVVVIKDNTCGKDAACRDLCLEDGTSTTADVYSGGDGTSTTAYVYSGGLVRGSWIGIGSTSGSSIRLSETMSVYEMRYFHAHTGSIGSKNEKTVEAKMAVTSSIFGNGRWMNIILIGGSGLIILMIFVMIMKRKNTNGFTGGGSL